MGRVVRSKKIKRAGKLNERGGSLKGGVGKGNKGRGNYKVIEGKRKGGGGGIRPRDKEEGSHHRVE